MPVATLTLKKLLNKDDTKSLVLDLTSAIAKPYMIEDGAGAVLMSSTPMPRSAGRFPISADSEIIGWVVGDDGLEPIASLLSRLAKDEQSRRSLAQETLERYRELSLFYEISDKIGTRLDLEEIGKLVINEAQKVIQADSISIMLLDDTRENLEIIAATGREYDPKTPLTVGEGIAGNVVLTGVPEIVNDVSTDPRYFQGSNETCSLLCTPLAIHGQVIGVLNVSSKNSINYTAGHIKLLKVLASEAAITIQNAKLYEQMSDLFLTTVLSLAETIEKRDPYTGGHVKRVMSYSLNVGRVLGLGESELVCLGLSAVLHDIGKIGVRDDVLLKEERLDPNEQQSIQLHSNIGAEILAPVAQLKDVIPGVKHHHENFDGSGYPDGLKGEEIDICARIICVADAYDAMTTDRPYRKALSGEHAVNQLKKYAGQQFDPSVVDAFLLAHGFQKDIEQPSLHGAHYQRNGEQLYHKASKLFLSKLEHFNEQDSNR